MKLYATVTSERASKGQGGNNRLEIDVFVGSAKNSTKIIEGTITPEGEGYVVYITTLGQGEEDQCIDSFVRIKGEKQKGDECQFDTSSVELGTRNMWCNTHNKFHR